MTSCRPKMEPMKLRAVRAEMTLSILNWPIMMDMDSCINQAYISILDIGGHVLK